MRDLCACRPIILIEVDNKRAHAAYCKALDELAEIWPAAMSEECRRQLDAPGVDNSVFGYAGPPILRCMERVNRIAYRRDLAGLAISPFRMPESAADELLKCESGLFAMEVRAQFAHATSLRRVEAPST